MVKIGEVKIPSDLLTHAETASDIDLIMQRRGFAVYAEKVGDNVRANFFGIFTDGDVNRTLKAIRQEGCKVDFTVEENGRQRTIDNQALIDYINRP
jgi:hypothetical protein